MFLNNKKIPLIPPFFDENKFVTNFLKKAELFNSFFSKQRSLINNGRTLPTHVQHLTSNRLSFVTISQDNTSKIIQNLDSGKAHCQDNISIYILYIYIYTIYIYNIYYIYIQYILYIYIYIYSYISILTNLLRTANRNITVF